jgi:hypothetical protein
MLRKLRWEQPAGSSTGWLAPSPQPSAVYHFHAAQADHESPGLRQQPGYFARQYSSFNAISDLPFAAKSQ